MPKSFGRYQVLGVLGKGSMGVVYKTKDPVIGRLVAVKSIPESLGLDTGKEQEYIRRLLQEAKAAGSLQHPNIVTIFDAGETELGPFIAMEYLDGVTLKEVLASGKKLTLAQITEIVRQVGDGLDYAAQRGIVHRDIKPANLMIVENNLVKIMDLGIARLPFSDLTREGRLVGSPSYMSPEQLKGEKLDGRSDLFSLGVVIYQSVTGKKPFPGQNIQEICYRIINNDFVPPSHLEPSLSEDFDRFMQKALAKSRDKRFQTGKEMFEAMRRILLAKEDTKISRTEEERSKEREIPTEVVAQEKSVYDESGSISSGSESAIDDIFRDLTLTHRSLKLSSENETRIWQIALGLIAGMAVIGILVWYLIRG